MTQGTEQTWPDSTRTVLVLTQNSSGETLLNGRSQGTGPGNPGAVLVWDKPTQLPKDQIAPPVHKASYLHTPAKAGFWTKIDY